MSMEETTTIQRKNKRRSQSLLAVGLILFVCTFGLSAGAQVPPLTEQKQAELGWSPTLKEAYAEFRTSTAKPSIDDRSMQDYFERMIEEGNAVAAAISQEQGEDNLGTALMKLEIASQLWQPRHQDYERYQQYILDGISMASRIEGRLPDYGAFLLSHLAFLQYQHGQEFEGEALMRHVIENGGIAQLRGLTNHTAKMLGDDDSQVNQSDPEQLAIQTGRLKAMVQALRLTNDLTQAERYEQRRKALITGQ